MLLNCKGWTVDSWPSPLIVHKNVFIKCCDWLGLYPPCCVCAAETTFYWNMGCQWHDNVNMMIEKWWCDVEKILQMFGYVCGWTEVSVKRHIFCDVSCLQGVPIMKIKQSREKPLHIGRGSTSLNHELFHLVWYYVGIFSTYSENFVRNSGKVGRVIYLRELTRDSFSISGLVSWNSLPALFPSTLEQFRRQLFYQVHWLELSWLLRMYDTFVTNVKLFLVLIL